MLLLWACCCVCTCIDDAQIHDPTTPNQQGADVGPQYRSIILYTSEEQKKVAEQVGLMARCLDL